MRNPPVVSVQIVVRNGARYIRHCLDAVCRQSYPNLQLIVLDNDSTDGTADIVAREYPQFKLFRHPTNLGMWPGHEYLLTLSTGEYVLALSVDVVLERDFISRAMETMLADDSIGALQGKVYQYAIGELEQRGTAALTREVIDTCGFGIAKSRRILNLGHGERDTGAFDTRREIFGVEGAFPLYRRSALLQCAVEGNIWDSDYFWYDDDFDLAWRMRLFGYRQILEPRAAAWHDRSTTKGAAHVPVLGQLSRLPERRAIPVAKRRLNWSNQRFTIIKNDYIMNVLRDIPWIVAREIAVMGYTVLFEPEVLRELGRFFRLLPRMFRRRRIVMRRSTVSAAAIHQWFQ